jgi:hypothetical protein
VIHQVKWRCGANHKICSEVKCVYVTWSEIKWNEVS